MGLNKQLQLIKTNKYVPNMCGLQEVEFDGTF